MSPADLYAVLLVLIPGAPLVVFLALGLGRATVLRHLIHHTFLQSQGDVHICWLTPTTPSPSSALSSSCSASSASSTHPVRRRQPPCGPASRQASA